MIQADATAWIGNTWSNRPFYRRPEVDPYVPQNLETVDVRELATTSKILENALFGVKKRSTKSQPGT